MNEKPSKELSAALNATLKGRFNPISVNLLLIFCALLCAIGIISASVLPLNYVFGAILLAVLVFVLIGVVVFACTCTSKGDSTERLVLKRKDGFECILLNPSKEIIPVMKSLYAASVAEPNALIPAGVDPQSDPATFQQLSDIDKKTLVAAEIEEALEGAESSSEIGKI